MDKQRASQPPSSQPQALPMDVEKDVLVAASSGGWAACSELTAWWRDFLPGADTRGAQPGHPS